MVFSVMEGDIWVVFHGNGGGFLGLAGFGGEGLLFLDLSVNVLGLFPCVLP